MFTGADAIAIEHVTDKDTTIAHLTGMCHLEENTHRALKELIATDNRNVHTLNHIGAINHTTIDALLTALTDAVTIMILKPVNVSCQQSLLDLLELGLTDNCLNFFHNLIILKNDTPYPHSMRVKTLEY